MVESRQTPEASNFLRRLGKNIRQDLSWLIAPFWTWTGVLLLSPAIYLLGVTAMYGKNHILAVVFYFIGVAYILAKSLSHTKTEARKAFKAVAIVLFFAGILAASLYWDWYIFRTDSQAPYIISGITEWLWLRLLSAWALPKKWIAASFAIGVLVTEVLRLLRERQRQGFLCPDERLHELVEKDEESIGRRVRIPWIIYQPYFDGAEPYIDFVFSIFNNSLFDLAIDNSIKGHIWSEAFDNPLHYEPKFFPTHPIMCGSRSGTNFVIRQALRVEEVSRFKGKGKDDLLIWFDTLEITFAGTDRFPQIGATQLNTKGFCLRVKEGAWRNPNDKDEFAFLYTDEQWAALLERQIDPVVPSSNGVSRLAFLRVEQHIVYMDDYGKARVYDTELRTASWRMKHPSFKILVAIYRNEPTGQPSSVLQVSAELAYELAGEDSHVIPSAVWFPENTSTVDIGYNDACGFILAERHKGEMIYGSSEKSVHALAPGFLKVRVRLFSAADGSIGEAGVFEIHSTTEPYRFDAIKID
jgi:hypothetical protein